MLIKHLQKADFLCNLRLKYQKITAIVEKIFNALSYRIVSCCTVIEDQTALHRAQHLIYLYMFKHSLVEIWT